MGHVLNSVAAKVTPVNRETSVGHSLVLQPRVSSVERAAHLSGARKVLPVESGSMRPKAPSPGQCPLALATCPLSEDLGRSESASYRLLTSGR